MLYCDPAAIRKDLGWSAKVDSIDEIIRTAYEWMRDNPDGYSA